MYQFLCCVEVEKSFQLETEGEEMNFKSFRTFLQLLNFQFFLTPWNAMQNVMQETRAYKNVSEDSVVWTW